MDCPRGNSLENCCTHAHSTNKNEASSNLLPEFDQIPQNSQKKTQEETHAHQFYPPVTGYLPLYTHPLATMNYTYLDLMRQMSLESEIRASFSKVDNRFDSNALKKSHKKKKSGRERMFEGDCFKNEHSSDEDCKEKSCCNPCSCLAQVKCKCCGSFRREKNICSVRHISAPRFCNCLSGSYPTLHSFRGFQHASLNCCHCRCQIEHPCCSRSQRNFGIVSQEPIDIPERETPHMCTQNIKLIKFSNENQTCTEFDAHSNLQENQSEKSYSMEKNLVKDVVNEDLTKTQENSDTCASDSEDDSQLMPSFLGGTGDESTKSKKKHLGKTQLLQSTAYFLPIN